MNNDDMKNHMDTLRSLLDDLRRERIQAIEFGNPENTLGMMSHHRIQIINTPAGPQFCFKLVARGMLGSGDYIGQPDDRTIEIKAQSLLERYFAPNPIFRNPTLLSNYADRLKEHRKSLKYFAIQFENERT